MKTALIITIGMHGIIHLFGFLKAFELSEMIELSLTISKPWGIVWLIAFLLFVMFAILLTINNDYWWSLGIIAVLVSQVLIISYWKNAKFGTIPNLIVLLSSVIVYSSFNFALMVNTEVSHMFLRIKSNQTEVTSFEMVNELPVPVQKWLNNSGITDHNIIQNIYLKQEALIKMKPEQKDWYKAEAEQYFTIQPPAFNWSVDLHMNPLMKVIGRDKFENGKGEMLIKVLSLFPVVNVKENIKVNQGTLQRYLAEIVWFPSAATCPYISWESIDDYSAKATMAYNETTGSGIFYYDKNGDFKKFSAMRFMEAEKESELKKWVVESIETEFVNGVEIPIEMKAYWKLDDRDWTWLLLKLTEIEYNIEKMPVARNGYQKQAIF